MIQYILSCDFSPLPRLIRIGPSHMCPPCMPPHFNRLSHSNQSLIPLQFTLKAKKITWISKPSAFVLPQDSARKQLGLKLSGLEVSLEAADPEAREGDIGLALQSSCGSLHF